MKALRSDKAKLYIFSFILFLLLLSVRLYILLPTFSAEKLDTYRVGLIPVNDGGNWVERAQYILENKKINMRPLFPLFLSIFIFIFGTNMISLVSVMILCHVFSIMTAFILLKNIRNNIFVCLILSFFSVWRLIYPADMMTENLASCVIIVAFSLVLSGLLLSSLSRLCLGYFLIGLCQAIRPWDFMSLATLPLVPIFLWGFKRRYLRVYLALVIFISFGYGFNFITAKIFSTSKQAKIDRANHLYGQVQGGKGDSYWILDKEIKIAMAKKISGELSEKEVSDLIFGKALKTFKEKPGLLFIGVFHSLKWYFKKMNVAFSGRMHTARFFLLFLFIYALYFFDWRKEGLRELIPGSAIRYYLPPIISIIIYKSNPMVFFMLSLVLGLVFLILFDKRGFLIFSVLYFLGIILSISAIGVSGSGRMWMSHELLCYTLSAIGITVLMFNKPSNLPEGRDTFATTDLGILARPFTYSVCVTLIVFVLLPLSFRPLYKHNSRDINKKITPELIVDQLKISGPVISQEILMQYIILWPAPTFERVNGSTAYWKVRYRPLKAFYYEADEGLDKNKWQFSKWHLQSFPFQRTAFDDRNPIIFPGATKEDLARFDGHEIVVVGKLLGRKRLLYFHQGFMIMAQYIGYPDKFGDLKWIKVEDL